MLIITWIAQRSTNVFKGRKNFWKKPNVTLINKQLFELKQVIIIFITKLSIFIHYILEFLEWP